ncbi:hypothetical protein CQA61_29970, partial [Klebsiella pneumoniae]
SKAPGAGGVKVENQTGVRTDWRGYAVLPYATEYANGITLSQPLNDTVVLVESPRRRRRESGKPDRGTHRLARVCRPALCH